VGGLLALPVSDTLKRVEAGRVLETTDRRQIWRAQTPQMFRYEALRTALREGLFEGALITDEASAIEWTGLKPRIIEGRPDNIKITRPEDLGLAAFFLEEQMKENAPNLAQGPSV
jgi:2-C-methyl-D-erythritol 4-phosphate cytidylyltransferase